MKIPKIEINRGTNRMESAMGKGRSFGKVAFDLFFFIPVTIAVSLVIALVVALGIPGSMVLFSNVMGGISDQTKIDYSDIPDFIFNDVQPDSPYYDAAMFLRKEGLIEGYEDGTLRLEEPITRAEIVKLVIMSQQLRPLSVKHRNCFKDVRDQWYAGAICLAKDRGWIGGNDGFFGPEKYLTRAEALQILYKAFDLKVPQKDNYLTFPDINEDDWFCDAVLAAQSRNLLADNPLHQNFRPHDQALRGEILRMLYRLLLL